MGLAKTLKMVFRISATSLLLMNFISGCLCKQIRVHSYCQLLDEQLQDVYSDKNKLSRDPICEHLKSIIEEVGDKKDQKAYLHDNATEGGPSESAIQDELREITDINIGNCPKSFLGLYLVRMASRDVYYGSRSNQGNLLRKYRKSQTNGGGVNYDSKEC